MEVAYRIVILSPIPVVKTDHGFCTIDLWARDLEKQAEVASVDLICPMGKMGETGNAGAEIPSLVRVFAKDKLTIAHLDKLILEADLIQIPGNFGWKSSALARRLLKRAQKARKVVILGVSSDRARTALLNSTGRGVVRSIKGIVNYIDIRSCQSWFAFRCDGVFVVGHGLARLFAHLNKNIHVDIASWINASDIVSYPRKDRSGPLKLCMASRLERMKGMHVGVSAVEYLVEHQRLDVQLTIVGEGPEKHNLQQQVIGAGLEGITSFLEPVAYPQPFLGLLDGMDIVLLTNLGSEQPRLIFDAISRGCLPLCPNSVPYRALGLDERLLYRQGDALDLHRAITRLSDANVRRNLRATLSEIAKTFTIEQMHRVRATWIRSLLPRLHSN
jgi:glycosyltransferase involved in cell wall biosynthesis